MATEHKPPETQTRDPAAGSTVTAHQSMDEVQRVYGKTNPSEGLNHQLRTQEASRTSREQHKTPPPADAATAAETTESGVSHTGRISTAIFDNTATGPAAGRGNISNPHDDHRMRLTLREQQRAEQTDVSSARKAGGEWFQEWLAKPKATERTTGRGNDKDGSHGGGH